MADARTWLEIAEACEAASGPDRDVDLALFNSRPSRLPYRFMRDTWDSRNPDPKLLATYILPNDFPEWRVPALITSDEASVVPVPSYTASVDAVLALIAEMLPEAGWTIRTHDIGVFAADITVWSGRAPTPALALCAALCRAIAAQPHSDPAGRAVEAEHG